MKSDQAELNREQTMTDLPLTAKLDGNGAVVIDGDRTDKFVAKGNPPHKFKFTLTDTTTLNVNFLSLDTEDKWSQCPPPGGGNSKQIEDVDLRNDKAPKEASFKDKNDNRGNLDICYRWNFTCDDPSKLPITFDPIIKNGGN